MKTDKEMMDIVLNMAKNDERIRLFTPDPVIMGKIDAGA